MKKQSSENKLVITEEFIFDQNKLSKDPNNHFNLPSIFKDESVISSIHTYFENKESPIICFKYNKPFCSTVFNYIKLVTELDIENSIPYS